jgi:hypothetical protein
MRTDKLTKVLLGVIAIALWMIALNPWLRPVPAAAQEKVSFESFECTGELSPRVKSILDRSEEEERIMGATKSKIGGYVVELRCR